MNLSATSFALGSMLLGLWIGDSAAAARNDEAPRMLTIGVIGGIGPQATMDFEARVHRAAQRLIPPRLNGGYPPMVVYYHRRAPFLIQDNGAPILPLRPDPEFLEGVRKVGAVSDFLVIVANGPHAIQEEIERASGRKVLSMVDLTMGEIRRRGWKKVGVLGMGDPVVLTRPLDTLQIEHETLAPEIRSRLNAAFFEVMEGRASDASRRLAVEAVETLRDRRVDGVLLGCTELPILLGAAAEEPDLLNPAELLAEAAVRAALGEGLDEGN